MGTRVLVLGATGSVGSKVVTEFDKNSDGVEVILSSSRPETTRKWQNEGRNAVTLDLNDPETFAPALANVDRVFL